jgi:hypothetical protein
VADWEVGEDPERGRSSREHEPRDLLGGSRFPEESFRRTHRAAVGGPWKAIRSTFELTEEQSRRYREWLGTMLQTAREADDPCPEITIAFTLTSIGKHIVA